MKHTTSHPFEKTIGPGPYKFVGFGKIHVSETFGARYIGPEVERGAGTCAHCGMAIMNIFVVRAGDGKNYGVGCDCIAKSNLPFEVKTAAHQAQLKHERELRRARNEARRARELELRKKQYEEFRPLWDASVKVKEAWKRQPHPSGYEGLSLADYIEWNLKRSNMRALIHYFTYLELERDGEM